MIPLKPLADEENKIGKDNAKYDKISEELTLIDD